MINKTIYQLYITFVGGHQKITSHRSLAGAKSYAKTIRETERVESTQIVVDEGESL